MEARPPFRFRKLRIAWSVAGGIACVLLIVFWARSYWIGDSLRLPASETRISVFSVKGTLSTSVYRSPIRPPHGWDWRSQRVSDMMPVVGPRRSWSYHSEGLGTYIIFPHRFLVLIVMVLAAAPWLPWRFSLRTLLIATTLVAMVLGLIVWAARK